MNTLTDHLSPVANAAGAYARGGEQIALDAMDLHLADVAENAACSLMRFRFRAGFPHVAYHELLSAVAALRAVLGFSPSPTAREVMAWQDEQRAVHAAALKAPKKPYPVRFVDGPYRGVEMVLDGPTVEYPSADDPLGHLASSRWIAGPPAFVPLPIVWGDTAWPGHGTVRYRREHGPDRDGMWMFRMRTDDPAPPEGSRPYITMPARPVN
ncbi:RsbRD N-terminal domain-containing protein [Streptomyces sp. bgisy060]|uniref:RsbRD N-terminal domain-containing protein n=1 Tax=Streptomyces sp. bgisy060 TaxID=3413775 RepID=UPI003EBE4168